MNDDDIHTEISRAVQPPPASGRPRATADCLVVIYTREPTLLGKRFVLEHNSTRVGRGVDNHIVLDGDSVSRRHAHFEQRAAAWLVVDLGSTNGTYCNDVQVSREAVLKNGDRVKIGPTIFKFLSGADVEAQYHEELYRMTIMDGLTQLHNKRYLYEALDREIIRSRRHERDLSVLMFDIDHFKRINEVYGHLAGDFVLKELARVIQALIRRDEVFARCGGEEFSIILPETTLDGAVALAQTLRQKLSEHVFVFQADSIRATISIGAALLQEPDRGATDLIKRADEYLNFAKSTGRNRVVSSPNRQAGGGDELLSHQNHHPVLDDGALLEKSLRPQPHGHLIAFEIEDEAAVTAQLGSNIFSAWFGDLVSGVDQAIGKDDMMATRRDRYVIAAMQDATPAEVASTVAAVRAIWIARRLPVEARAVQPGLRAAVVTPGELAQHGKRAMDVLVGRLLPPKTPEDDLPFLIAAPKAAISTRRTAYRRVVAILDALSAALRFIVAAELALLRDSGDHDRKRRAAVLLAEAPLDGQPLPMAAWGACSGGSPTSSPRSPSILFNPPWPCCARRGRSTRASPSRSSGPSR